MLKFKKFLVGGTTLLAVGALVTLALGPKRKAPDRGSAREAGLNQFLFMKMLKLG